VASTSVRVKRMNACRVEPAAMAFFTSQMVFAPKLLVAVPLRTCASASLPRITTTTWFDEAEAGDPVAITR
jgi:hypothetical protein